MYFLTPCTELFRRDNRLTLTSLPNVMINSGHASYRHQLTALFSDAPLLDVLNSVGHELLLRPFAKWTRIYGRFNPGHDPGPSALSLPHDRLPLALQRPTML